MIGAGSGGLTVAIGLAGFGRRVALVEASRVGGDCTNTGCIPSKRLIHLARQADSGNSARVLADVRATRDGLADRERRELIENPRIELVEGAARLTGPQQVRVATVAGDRTFEARHVIVATGSRARTLEIPGLPAERLLTNSSLFDLSTTPQHLAIIGAGAIGLEMACAFRRLGSRVSLIDLADRVLPIAVPDASATVAAALAQQGITIRLGARVTGYDADAQVLVVATPDGTTRLVDVDRVLVAIGREPNTGGLGLDTAGVRYGPQGIHVDAWGRTSTRSVWAVGDVTPGSHQTHAANANGRRIVQRIALPWLPALGGPPVIPSAVFSDPEVAWVGLSTAELSRRCNARVVTRIRIDLPATDRGLTDGVTGGFVAIDAVRLTGRILSATVVGPHASELIAVLTLAMHRRTSLFRLSRMVYAYPTFAGAIGKAADEFARQTLGNVRKDVSIYARYRFSGGDRKTHG